MTRQIYSICIDCGQSKAPTTSPRHQGCALALRYDGRRKRTYPVCVGCGDAKSPRSTSEFCNRCSMFGPAGKIRRMTKAEHGVETAEQRLVSAKACFDKLAAEIASRKKVWDLPDETIN